MKDILTALSKWISTEDIEVLPHGLNFSTWVDLYPCTGRWKMEVSKAANRELRLEIFMPVAEWGKPHTRYFTVYSGILHVEEHNLRIQQDEGQQIKLSCSRTTTGLKIHIYSRWITFERE
ncbi:MAG: hypothetical protein MUC38_12010 [Cyclobacteriaceae bacterium]|jgi:hypothetical protein|nr:hypothetical protein [Cyclobacteriaceae bacterium]